MNTRQQDIWFNGETEFVGITGADSFDEAAQVILDDNNPDILDLVLDVQTATLSNIRAGLMEVGIRVMAVPSAIMRHERWDGSNIYRINERDRPGRGYVKVFGFNP